VERTPAPPGFAFPGGALHDSRCARPARGRAGRRIKELLLEEADRGGARLAPPSILTTGRLAELFHSLQLPLASPLLSRRVWAENLQRLQPEALQSLFGRVPEGNDLRGWDLLGGQVQRLQRETAGGGHRFGDVAEICRGGDLLFDDAVRWDLLAGAQTGYERMLLQLGFADLDLERLTALGRGRLRCELEVWLIGIAELAPVARAILRSSQSPIGALIHAPEEESNSFDDLGCVIEHAWGDRVLPVGDEHILIADRPADQAAHVLTEIAAVSPLRPDDVVVALAEPDLRPYVVEWLEAAGVSVHFAAGVPVRSSGPFRLLAALADYLDRHDWESFAALVRHPDLESFLRAGGSTPFAGADPPTILDRFFTRHLPADLKGDLPDRGYGGLESLRRRLNELLGGFGSERPVREWAAPILAVLGNVYSVESLNTRDPADRRLVETLEKVRDAALTIHRLPVAVSPPTDGAAAIRIMLDDLRTLSVPEDPEPVSAELLGWLEVPLDDAPIVLVAGANEPGLPEAVNADPFLPDSLRARLGITDNALRYARDAFHLAALVHSRRRVRFVAGRLSASGDPLRLSRLLLAVPGEVLARRILSFVERKSGGASIASPLLAAAGEQSRFQLPPDPVLRIDPVPTEIAVTDFRAILEDPYRYVLHRMMKLETLADEARELDGGSFGHLAHRVLQRFAHSEAIHSLDAARMTRSLDALLDDEASARFGSAAFPAVHLQVEMLRIRLHALARWQAGRVAEGWRVVLVEGVPAGSGADSPEEVPFRSNFDVDGEPVTLVGRIDRIDHHPGSGAWAVLDYKTGDQAETPEERHRRKRSGIWKDLQLPLYRHLARAALDPRGVPLVPEGAALEMGYVLLCRETERVGLESADWGVADLEGADEAAREVIRSLRRGSVRFDRDGIGSRRGDPLGPLLGRRLLSAAEADEEPEVTT
jgi:ATP-dependent helicase/nuclease subunit B